MKKALIMAYDFPPYVSVGGLRPFSWYKYFHEFDVEPVIITRQWNNHYGNHLDYISPGTSLNTEVEVSDMGTIMRTPYIPNLANRIMLKYGSTKFKLFRKFISAFYEIFQWVFLIGPKVQLYHEARKYLKSNKVDVIIVTGDPFILFRYADRLSKEFNIPWIADYRDPWSNDVFIKKKYFFKRWSAYFEKRIVKNASLITTVSDFVKAKISEVVKHKEFYIMPNGFDPEVIDHIKHVKQHSDNLCIAFAGTLVKWNPIVSFLKAIDKHLRENVGAKITVNFYGINEDEMLKDKISKEIPELTSYVHFTPKLPNHLLLEKLKENNIMLLFNYYSLMGTKIYDYIGIKRMILFCYSNDLESKQLKSRYFTIEDFESLSHQLQEDLIHKTNSGIIVKDVNELNTVIHDLYTEFKTNGFISCNSIETENYSRKIQVKQLAGIIHQMAK